MVPPDIETQSLHAAKASNRGTAAADSPATLRIAETFTSRQGEGQLTGVDSFFIRVSGCNLRCWFCDTSYASWNPEGDHVHLDELTAMVDASGVDHVVLTGGEPLLFAPVVELCNRLRDRSFHVTIETAGTIDPGANCDLLSLSPKFASSAPDADKHPAWARRHEHRRLPIDVMNGLIDRAAAVQVKFVVDSPADYDELIQITDQLHVIPADVWIMPQGRSVEKLDEAASWLAPWCQNHGFQYCDRMQIRWYGDVRGT